MMADSKKNSPLLGYNTNAKHSGKVFHIQTEDSGVGHPHIITHLFTAGTILATKKTSYAEYLERDTWEDEVRQLMKDQHKAMFVELRDGAHDVIAARILGEPVGDASPEDYDRAVPRSEAPPPPPQGVEVIAPAQMMGDGSGGRPSAVTSIPRGISIFETPDTRGSFGDSLISDKSLDEVILTYLKDELDE